MKYGILLNKNNLNIGDDIQAFALAQFLPRVDYLVDREEIDDFRPDEEEPVAIIMNAWYMWRKWNWPPSKYIVPKFIGFHYADHQLAKQPGSPVKYEFLNGLGGEYLKAYQPIGCRDEYTRSQLEKLGIESYFSGCITMTLPKMPETNNKGTYICLVDIHPTAEKKIRDLLKGTNIKVKTVTHNRERNYDMTWEEREKFTTDLLTLYQNARCVVTKRLHCALPCLAMEVPVFLVKDMQDDIRFTPYYDFLHRTTVKDLLADQYDYDFVNPPANKENYKVYREQIIRDAQCFIEEMEQSTGTVEEMNRFPYSEQEVINWRHDVMKEAMNDWFVRYRDMQNAKKKSGKKMDALKAENKKLKKSLAFYKSLLPMRFIMACRRKIKKWKENRKKR